MFWMHRSALFAMSVGAVLGQTPAASPVFEVASIKTALSISTDAVKIDGARVSLHYRSLASLIEMAYRVQPYQLIGPDRILTGRWDIDAKIPPGVSKDQIPEMLQALLSERFKLVVHYSMADKSVYALVTAKNGPRIRPTEPELPRDSVSSEEPSRVRTSATPAGKKLTVENTHSGEMNVTIGPGGVIRVEFASMTMPMLATKLTAFVDRPVVDMTELKGGYRITLDLSMAEMARTAQASPGAGASTSPPNDAALPPGPSVFSSLQQLGLKLEGRKVALPTLVIDHLEKTPTEN